MFRLIKSYQPANLLLILFLTTALSMRFFFDAGSGLSPMLETFSLYNPVFNFLNQINSPVLNRLLVILLIFFEAFFITVINNQYNLLGNRSYLPMFIYFLIVINFIEVFELNPAIFANILFLIAWAIVKKARAKANALSNYFNAAILIGVASLFYFNYIFLSLILLINLLIVRRGRGREILWVILGVFIVWYFVIAYFYLKEAAFNTLIPEISLRIDLSSFTEIKLSEKIAKVYIFLLFVSSIFSILGYFTGIKIEIRNNLKLLFVIFILGALLILLTGSSKQLIHLTAIPVSLFISKYFLSAKRTFVVNILISLLLLITVFNVYFGYLIN